MAEFLRVNFRKIVNMNLIHMIYLNAKYNNGISGWDAEIVIELYKETPRGNNETYSIPLGNFENRESAVIEFNSFLEKINCTTNSSIFDPYNISSKELIGFQNKEIEKSEDRYICDH